jgi:hypothetical protein
MSDLFGHIEPSAPFKDIGNQRPSVAEEKAQLCLTLNRLLQTPPPCVRGRVDPARPRVALLAQAGASRAAEQSLVSARAADGDQHHAGV